jgi:hypothetical protein
MIKLGSSDGNNMLNKQFDRIESLGRFALIVILLIAVLIAIVAVYWIASSGDCPPYPMDL